jgi:large subunit ribosomal protein L6
MSRVGNRVLTMPEGVEVKVNGLTVEVKGKLGELQQVISPLIAIHIEEGKISFTRASDEKHVKQLHGTTSSLISNMITGVSEGYKKELEIKGVGYKANLKGNKIEVNAGYSHPVLVQILEGLKLELPKPTEIIITGISKQKVGEMAAVIRKIRKPNPYSGKGISYKGEQIRRKEGKAAGK